MTTKVIIDNHARFNLVVDSVENGKIVNTTVIPADQEHYETIVHSSKSIEIEEGDANKPFDFGKAIKHLKAGKKVARSGWNGKGMYLLYVPGTPGAKLQPGTPYYKNLPNDWVSVEGENPVAEILPHIDMWTINAQGRRAFLPGWLASQSDMLADDWVIVD